MKIFKSMVVVLFFAIKIHAQNTGVLTIGTTGKNNLQFTLNNQKYSPFNSFFTFGELAAGSYALTIYQLQEKINGSEWVEVFRNKIDITVGKHLEIIILRFGKLVWDQGDNRPDAWLQSGSKNNNFGNSVTNEQFSEIKAALGRQFTDQDKLNRAKIIFRNNSFTVNQIIEIGRLFFSDNYKYDFSIFAYDYCYEKGMYFKVANIFFDLNYKNGLLAFLANK